MELTHVTNWYALYTKSRAEKKVLASLGQLGIEAYLPMHNVLRRWSDRKKWVEMPLISRYLFVRICLKQYDSVLQSNFIVSYVRFEGKAATIPDKQIDFLKLLLKQNDIDLEITQEKFETGQLIEVTSGPLIGLQGKLMETKGKNKLAVELEQLGYSALVEIKAEDVRIVSDYQN